MARKFLTPIDLNKLELQNAAFQNLGTPPLSPSTGQFYYDTSVSPKQLKVYDGTSWVVVGASSGGFSEEEIEDIVDGLIVAGTGIGKNYNDSLNTLTISNTGVTSITGTSNEISVSASTGAVTISLPDTINAAITGNAATATKWASPITISLGSDLSGSASIDGSSNVTINATIAANSVELGTDTTGNYVASITGTTNEIEVSGSGESAAVTIGLPDSVTIGNLNVTGALTVSGSATYVNTEIIELADNIIILNSNATGSASQNAGIEVERGTDTNVSLLWNETNDNWTLTNDGTNYHEIIRKYSTSIGNSASTQFSVTHNLGTRDVLVQVYDNTTYETVEVYVERTTSNTVTLQFAVAPSSNAYRVVISG